MRSYRIASLIQSLFYLLLVASYVAYPINTSSIKGSITYQGTTYTFPMHYSFFQEFVGGTWVWAGIFAIGGVWLFLSAAWPGNLWPGVARRSRMLILGHAYLFVVMFAFGIGYIVAETQLHAGWSTGALALIIAAGHGLALRAHPPTVGGVNGHDFEDVAA